MKSAFSSSISVFILFLIGSVILAGAGKREYDAKTLQAFQTALTKAGCDESATSAKGLAFVKCLKANDPAYFKSIQRDVAKGGPCNGILKDKTVTDIEKTNIICSVFKAKNNDGLKCITENADNAVNSKIIEMCTK